MKALELFAVIGGIALAEQMAGIEVVGLSEIEDYPVRILKKVDSYGEKSNGTTGWNGNNRF